MQVQVLLCAPFTFFIPTSRHPAVKAWWAGYENRVGMVKLLAQTCPVFGPELDLAASVVRGVEDEVIHGVSEFLGGPTSPLAWFSILPTGTSAFPGVLPQLDHRQSSGDLHSPALTRF